MSQEVPTRRRAPPASNGLATTTGSRTGGASPRPSTGRGPAAGAATTPGSNGTAASGTFQRAPVTAAQRAPGPALPIPEEPAADPNGAADGFLINGSVNNGAASPFAQPAAFGNNRRRGPSLYNFAVGIVGGTSAWDARPSRC